MLGPHRGAKGRIFRIAAGDASHQPIGLRQVEAGILAQGHDRGRGVGDAAAGAHRQHALIVAKQGEGPGRKGVFPRQGKLFHPTLKLPRGIARGGTPLKHGDHYGFDRFHGPAWEGQRKQQEKQG